MKFGSVGKKIFAPLQRYDLGHMPAYEKNPMVNGVSRKFAAGKFAAGKFTAGKFAVRKIRRWENFPLENSPWVNSPRENSPCGLF